MVAIEIRGRVFPCVDRLPGALMLRLGAAHASRDPAAQAGAVWDLIRYAVLPDVWPEFEAWVMDQHGGDPVSAEELAEAAGGLIQEYAERPTGRPSDSRPSPRPSGQSSRDGWSSLGTEPEVRTFSLGGRPRGS